MKIKIVFLLSLVLISSTLQAGEVYDSHKGIKVLGRFCIVTDNTKSPANAWPVKHDLWLHWTNYMTLPPKSNTTETGGSGSYGSMYGRASTNPYYVMNPKDYETLEGQVLCSTRIELANECRGGADGGDCSSEFAKASTASFYLTSPDSSKGNQYLFKMRGTGSIWGGNYVWFKGNNPQVNFRIYSPPPEKTGPCGATNYQNNDGADCGFGDPVTTKAVAMLYFIMESSVG
jgi:hypothetical protein